jgi:GNAT superfamily N-acetyltransferase
MNDDSIRLRRGTPADQRATFDIAVAGIHGYLERNGVAWDLDPDSFYDSIAPVLDYYAVHNAEWWVAEDPSDGSLLGFARSIERGGMLELTEFFVRPDRQSAGLGRRLLEKALPPGRGEVRAIVATTDPRATASYYRAGTVARFPIAEMTGPTVATRAEAEAARSAAGLEMVEAGPDLVAEFASIDEAVTGYPRHDEFPMLFAVRDALLFRRDGRPVGFAFASPGGIGPIAALDAADLVPILVSIEAWALTRAQPEIELEVPMINEVAMRHLLGRGFRINPPMSLFMTSVPFGRFDRYVMFGPPIVF